MDTMMSKAAPAPTALERAVAQALNNVRSERGLSIQDLANRALDEQTGRPIMSRPSLSRVFDGSRPLYMGEVFALCQALGLNPITVLALAQAQVAGR